MGTSAHAPLSEIEERWFPVQCMSVLVNLTKIWNYFSIRFQDRNDDQCIR